MRALFCSAATALPRSFAPCFDDADCMLLARPFRSASPSVVQGNLFIDNSDINLIFGSGSDSLVSDNIIFEMQNGAFGGVMFDNFNGHTDGNFVGMEFHSNQIECNGRCDFGLELGPHPW
jgi:hypothetical protein